MRFVAIEIENLLAYEGMSRIELPEPTVEQNVVLIWGRNGMGKTSFLTALKVLFTGIEDEQYRRAGLKPGNTSERAYVMGDGANWLGIFNRRALEQARRTSGRVTARVSATWAEGDRIFQAQRSWSTDGHTYEHQIVVFDGDDRLVRGAAETRLEELLPRDFVDFFFFDGEEVKELAEGIGKKAVDVDRLLDLTFVDELATGLDEVVQRRLRGNAESKVKAEIEAVEKDQVRVQRTVRAASEELKELESQIASTTADLAHLQTRRENLAVGASGAVRDTLEERQKTVRNQLKAAIATVASTVPPLAPFYANFGLVGEAMKAVDKRLTGAATAEAALLRTVKDGLPDWIDKAEVDLRPDQRTQLVLALSARLEGLKSSAVDEGPFKSLDLERAERLRARLLRWTIAGASERDLQASNLEAARQHQLDLDQIADALMRIEAGSQANVEEYKRLVHEIAKAEGLLAEWNQRKGQLNERIREGTDELLRLTGRLERLYDDQEHASRVNHEARFMRTVARALREFRDARRQSVKAKLETAINLRFGQLAHAHRLVDRIKLTDVYTMEFLDGAQRPVGRASLSSGLKQIAATALLWAMKDVSGRDIPVVIDTPLGRIDRENQHNLLDSYYPEVARQVIVLPTNSEIDSLKLARLAPHVARHFLIENDAGDRARILPDRQLVEVI